jgi:endonuclease YncB( thermonuclease family)
MTRILLAALAALILVPASAAAADNLTGQASVIDGDTLEVHGTRKSMPSGDPKRRLFSSVATTETLEE